jgi:hypothetical protein
MLTAPIPAASARAIGAAIPVFVQLIGIVRTTYIVSASNLRAPAAVDAVLDGLSTDPVGMTLSPGQKFFAIAATGLSALVEDIFEIGNGVEFGFCVGIWIGIWIGNREGAREDESEGKDGKLHCIFGDLETKFLTREKKLLREFNKLLM